MLFRIELLAHDLDDAKLLKGSSLPCRTAPLGPQAFMYSWCINFIVAYPEPIPVVRGEDAKRLLYRLEHPEEFPLSPELKEFYRDAMATYKRMSPRHQQP